MMKKSTMNFAPAMPKAPVIVEPIVDEPEDVIVVSAEPLVWESSQAAGSPAEPVDNRSREELTAEVERYEDYINQVNGSIADNKAKLVEAVDSVIKTGEGDSDTYRDAKTDLFLLEDVAVELTKRLKTARLAVWMHDLNKAKAEYGDASREVRDTRMELARLQSELAAKLRAGFRRPNTPELVQERSNYEVMMLDCRTRGAEAAKLKRIKLQEWEDLKADFNLVALELGASLEDFKSNESRLSNR
jgi:hypothetical protein